MTHLLAQQVAFQAVWLACALGPAWGRPGTGLAAAALFVGFYLIRSRNRRSDALLAAAAVALGAALDAVLVGGRFVAYAGAPSLAGGGPPWILGLWAAFALTLPACFAWLRGRRRWAALLGGVGGALAYAAGERLGALAVAPGAAGWIVLGLGWALAMPALVELSAWLERSVGRGFPWGNRIPA